MLSDPIADMLTRVRNANLAGHERVEMPASKLKAEIARVLQEEGYIAGFGIVGDAPQLQLWLELKRATKQGKALNGLRRVSRPGLRVYRGSRVIPRVLGGLGIAIVSTPKGIMSGRQARQQGVGGEVIAEVW
ncbi:MAG TPA: 30S ribosomal protein S8 [Candidatus Nanopelagicaceae bacterium]|nr:30S ribosomal protein S8 [Candidatus Nanopelagicaceae bacterium]